MDTINRTLFEKLLLFFLIVSWVDFPRIIYDKFSLDTMTAFHGKNLLPFFGLGLILFVVYSYCRSAHFTKFKSITISFFIFISSCLDKNDRLAILFILYMILVNVFSAMINHSDFNFRMVIPIFFAHCFYFFYKRFSEITVIDNIHAYFFKYVVYIISTILLFQLAMFMGLVPGVTQGFSPEIIPKITNFIRVDAEHIGYTAYLAIILLYILLFMYEKIPNYQLISIYFLIFSVLVINQTRGAILIGSILLLNFFLFSIKLNGYLKFFFLTALFLTIWLFFENSFTHRIFILSTVDTSASARVFQMIETFKHALESPFFGYGSYYAQNLRFGDANQIVHSYYLRLFVSYGLIGILIFLFYFKSLFASKLTHKSIMGLFVIFGIFTFEPYLMWAVYLIAVFSNFSNKKNSLKLL